MFNTHESGRHQFASGLFGPGFDSWNFMTIDIWVPWFIVTLNTVDEEGNSWSSSLCLHRVGQLEEVTQQSDKTLARLHLMTPTKAKPNGWQLDEVSKISRFTLDAQGSCAYELVLASGQSTWLPLDSAYSFSSQPISKQEIWKQ